MSLGRSVIGGDEIEAVPLYVSVWNTRIDPLDPPQWGGWQTPFWDALAAGERDISPRTPDSSRV